MKSTQRNTLATAMARCHPRGFALIVTLSLMILLTVIAVGLLTLSTISLRSSSQGDSMQVARANARMAMMLAIGDLQKQLGPDTRVSATADQVTGSDPSVSTTPQTQRQWAGAYNSWPAALPSVARPTPEFRQWFVSGDPTKTSLKTFAAASVGTDAKTSVEIVTKNTVGASGDPVRVPMVTMTAGGGSKNNMAWWVSDLGTKALIGPGKDLPTTLADTRHDQQVAPATNLKSAVSGSAKPFATLAVNDPKIAKVSTWQSTAFLADSQENIRGLFHDLTSQSRGLLTDVRAGGFRKDLSMELERPSSSQPNAATTALYKVGNETGINLQELWTYYNLYSPSNNPRGLKTSGTASFTTGGSMVSGTPYLQLESSPTACQSDDGFYFKQPVVINYQLVLSFETRPVTVGSSTVNRLYLVADPILTFWNPLDVPVVIPKSSFLTVKYWQIPYDMSFTKNGTALPQRYPLISSLSAAVNGGNGDGNFLSLQAGQVQQLVFKPGEVIKVSQSGSAIVKGTSPVDHALVGKAGFNYGGGVSDPVRDIAGGYIDLKSTDVINFKLTPNNLTAGATSASGHSLNGSSNHTRHFSLTHHEYYVGADRVDLGDSLGIGGMFIDWDFGNRRLKPTENRGTTAPGIGGTKPPAERLYADSTSLKDIFKTITDGRPLPASILTTKQPVLLLSYNAKTENGSTLGTSCLSRFNPKALHVDFYDLKQQERDMLPYEYSVQSLQSWKNSSLETSSNGNAYFGGGMDAATGSSFVTTHSVPREPLVSLAAFQYSFANGFDIQKPKFGYGTLNAREPMLPQISHAIGNSMACPVIPSNSTEGTLSGGRPLADHSYLANQALWDEWFLSGIAPQNTGTFGKSRTQKTVASDFFSDTAKLPVARYRPELNGQTPAKILSTYFAGSTPSAAATLQIASLIRVDGMFNVNSTSVEAWKSLLGGRKERPIIIRDVNGKESVKTGEQDTPVAGLFGPRDLLAKGSGSIDSQEPNQWTGRRALTDADIDALARALVKEVRKRGPFLSLADFVNRRVGSDSDLARSGAVQSALDSNDVSINSAYRTGSRATSGGSSLAFQKAEQGPLSYGIPGIVKQADILTPVAPVLSARSDSFLVRGYGEKTDAGGKVLARAWCEAVVQRAPQFIDSADAPEKTYNTINTLNKTFGRRFDIVSFRWLNPLEA